ncbi:MAG: HAMP domain-containing protein [Proteobacteria bacterium]|nr:HAMP domain-containing protein [Pseudomonadota bacterium]MCH9711521.1 HAMP domain-containing protein [Pseudomonadota bacterium]
MTKTLFGRTSLIITSTMLAFLIATIAIAGYFIILPVGKRNAEDLASLIHLSAKTYVELPPETRQDFINELSKNHQLFWGSGSEQLAAHTHLKPHFHYMESNLSNSLGSTVDIAPDVNNPNRHWVDINIAGESVRLGFDRNRIGVSLPSVALYLLSILAIMATLSSLILVRKLTKPIQQLSEAASMIGLGNAPEILPEEGPKELAQTAKAFNKMSADVQNLLENRTVLLGGISHDLRTPLTRMTMALEMLPNSTDTELKRELVEAVDNMELIIQEYMQLTKGFEDEDIECISINTLITTIIKEIKPDKDQVINLVGDTTCQLETYVVALHRVLFNLIKNAVSYGNKNPISISWKQQGGALQLAITDQGYGIPKQHQDKIFRPFYRLESSRNRASGGTGLGLAIVDQIITRRAWKINLVSNDNGTTITVLI